ncbi:peroxidase 24-like [Aristolochia californica]|uniref:peroxidase 24-like n=1 Tax=Aristolochia californica TaxID=171875 RepID=UPI0035D859F4
MRGSFLLLLVSLVVFGGIGNSEGNALKMHFYKKSCSHAEDIVRNVTWTLVAADHDLAPDLLRIHYHDCFVRGCDASVLLESNGKEKPEKEALPNLTLKGFDVIDKVKARVEEECPGVVSCADVVALVARDAVSFQFQKPMWAVLTGRRDGVISRATEALSNLPSPFMDFPALRQLFGAKRLDADDLVVLSGAHTIGEAHCAAFQKRLFNLTGKGDVDRTLDSNFAKSLRKICPNPSNPATTVDMDLGSGDTFDSNYYVNLLKNKALFHSDAALLQNNRAAKLARKLTNQKNFFNMFAKSIRKMGDIELLTGTAGEIRKKCSVVNS